MGTIEYIDQNISSKINILFDILNKFIPYSNTNDALKLKEKLELIEEKYYILSSDVENIDDYHILLSKHSIPEIIKNIFENIKILKKNEIPPKNKMDIQNLIKKYGNIPNYKSPQITKKYEKDIICKRCGGDIITNNETSEMICNSCGIIENIVGTVFDDAQIYHQEGSFTKHGSYERIKHGTKWLDRIQARENVEIPRKVIKDTMRWLGNEGITDIRKIVYSLIREGLSKTKHSKYNDHIPLIIKIITGIEPPQLTTKEYDRIIYYFDIAVYWFEQTKSEELQNCPYHPYFIRKIMEQTIILPENTNKQIERKRKIISNIHIQSDKTLSGRDSTWELICEKIPEFIFMITDKNKYDIVL